MWTMLRRLWQRGAPAAPEVPSQLLIETRAVAWMAEVVRAQCAGDLHDPPGPERPMEAPPP